jgi:uncharacterized lipoprotein YddW (UPF0748 family)
MTDLRPAGAAAPRELRGAWVATVGTSTGLQAGLPVDQQKKEMIDILDRCAALNLNAIFLQVRPSADAMYQSTLEPWSEYLTGVQGQPPRRCTIRSTTWIDESHKRGMELHAWFNPYRVKAGNKGNLAANSIGKTHPEVVKQYGKLPLDGPGEPAAAQHTLNVILDIVKRYDVDGVHTDDYYYPYKIKQNDKIVDFPDDPSWQKYQQSGGKLARADWRRPERQSARRKNLRRDEESQAVGQGQLRPLRHLESRQPAGHQGHEPVRRALRRREALAQQGLARHVQPAALLEDRRRPGFRRAA